MAVTGHPDSSPNFAKVMVCNGPECWALLGWGKKKRLMNHGKQLKKNLWLLTLKNEAEAPAPPKSPSFETNKLMYGAHYLFAPQ